MTHGGFIAVTVKDHATGRRKVVLLCQPLVATARRGTYHDTEAQSVVLRETLEAVERGELDALQGFCGECFGTPEADRVRERLRDALGTVPQPSTGVLHHGMGRENFGARKLQAEGIRGDLLLRPVAAWGGAGADAAAVERAAWPSGADAFETDDPDQCATLLLLTHTFELPAEPGGSRVLMLQTLASIPELEFHQDAASPCATAMRVVFGGATIALQRGGFATCVRLDGRVLGDNEAAALRTTLHHRVKAQLLHALNDCVQHRWAGGFLALRHAVVQLLGVEAPTWLEPLAQRLLAVRLRTCNPVLAKMTHAPAMALINSFT